ncbi:MAG: SoxR reducing system RseC family protein [Clostridia bacterium]|nr:SoxR reducing system RseC family protein [Clostridia bacterium]
MVNKGVVKEVLAEELVVVFERQEACGDCHACMHGSGDCAKHTIRIKGKAEVGDIVEVEMDDSHVVAATAVAYMIPFAGLMLGLFAGWALSRVITAINGELLMAMGAVVFTALAYVVMRFLDPIFSKGRWEQKIISVTKPEE